MSIIHAALCDNDGTIVETEPVLYAAWAVLVERDGGDFRTFDYARIIGKPDIECCRIVLGHFELDHDPAEWHEHYKVVAYEMFTEGVPLRPGVHYFLDRLDRAKIPAVIVTSGTKEHMETVLGPSGLLPRFALAVTADTPGLTARKPDPAPYLLAARLMGVDPTRCIAFEDSPSGIRSAVGAGCLTYAIPHAHSPAENLGGAHVVLSSLTDFRVEDAVGDLLSPPLSRR
jgi:HAD superfamily hydrolase (TIGR01509 family)